MLLLKNADSNVACKVAIAGDFLPSYELHPTTGLTWSDMAAPLAAHFADVDMSIVNLECPIGVRGISSRVKFGLGANFAGPEESLSYLTRLKTAVVGLANNHSHDFGWEGVGITRHAILRRNMCPIGGVASLADAPEVAIWQGPAGIRVGCWAAARGLPELASGNRRGVEPATLRRGLAALARLSGLGAKLKVALLHTGLERTNRPDPDDVSLMRSLAKAGFNVVAAAHSHRISGWESVTREDGSHSFCFYGLGSVTSTILYSALEREGAVIVVGLDGHGKVLSLEARPVYLRDTGWGSVPEEPMSAVIEERFVGLSREISTGAFAVHFYHECGRGLFRRQLADFRAALRNGGVSGLTQKIGRVRTRHLKRVLRAALS